DNPNLDKGVLSSPCPVDLPEKEGWAQLGRTDVEMPEKAKGAFKVEIPFNFDQPVLLVPGKPMNLQAVSGNESVSLTWDDPEVDGGGDISEYVIQYSPGSGSTTTSGNSTTISGLTNGTSYNFRVAAKNSAGQGLFTTAVTATPSPVSVTLSSSTPSPTNSDISVTATFGTPVTGFELGDISVTNGTAKNFSGSGSSYAFQVTPAGSPVTISVPSGKAQGPNSISNTASNVLNRIFDATSPTVALSSDSSSGDTIVTATFSEEVTGFELGDVAVTNGTKDNFSGSGTTYTFRVALSSGAASMIITVPAGVAEDAAGNGNISASITLNTVSPQPPPNPPAAAPCSGSCYEDSIAKANGSATGPDGVEMEYLQADPNCVPTKAQPCFKIWRENNLLNGQKRILNASGLVVHGWQKILDRKGLGFSGDDLNPDNIKLIEGRVCPNNVFLDYNNMNAASRCVYYTSTISNAKLNDYSQGTPFEDFLENWNQEVSGAGQGSSYYEG
ncbi:fibronectin type III domain-containing protein, partial [bacterium]|nr:fibronectin type III domain-containing protein [bacterium]